MLWKAPASVFGDKRSLCFGEDRTTCSGAMSPRPNGARHSRKGLPDYVDLGNDRVNQGSGGGGDRDRDLALLEVGSGRMCGSVRSAPASSTPLKGPPLRLGTRTPTRATPSTLPSMPAAPQAASADPAPSPGSSHPPAGAPLGSGTCQSPPLAWQSTPSPDPPHRASPSPTGCSTRRPDFFTSRSLATHCHCLSLSVPTGDTRRLKKTNPLVQGAPQASPPTLVQTSSQISDIRSRGQKRHLSS